MNSHGTGKIKLDKLKFLGRDTIIEEGVLIFHPENISIGNNVYIGHNTILHGYHNNDMVIGDNTWIGPQCYFHSAGGLYIENYVGIGPSVKILTSYHIKQINMNEPIIKQSLVYEKVILEYGCDIGIGAIILPGVTIKIFSQVGGGAVVNKSTFERDIVVGVPAKSVRW